VRLELWQESDEFEIKGACLNNVNELGMENYMEKIRELIQNENKLFLFILSLLACELFVLFVISPHDADYKQEQISPSPYPNVSEKVTTQPEKVDKKPRRRITNLEKGFIESGEKVKFSDHTFIKRDEAFDPKYVDGTGRSNIERMKKGLAPIAKDGKEVELHHIKQKDDGIIVEVSRSEHAENSKIFHRYTPESEIDRERFGKLRRDYWKDRAKDF